MLLYVGKCIFGGILYTVNFCEECLQEASLYMMRKYYRITPLHMAPFRPIAFMWEIMDSINEESINISMRPDDITPLHLAVFARRWDLVLIFVKKGADINKVDKKWKEVPLHMAIRRCAPNTIVSVLISSKNVNSKSQKSHLTPLELVMRKSLWRLIPILMEKGADVKPVITCEPCIPKPLSLVYLCALRIHDQLKEKSAAAYENTGLPRALMDCIKLRTLSDDIVELCIRQYGRSDMYFAYDHLEDLSEYGCVFYPFQYGAI